MRSRSRAATARPLGPAPMIRTSWRGGMSSFGCGGGDGGIVICFFFGGSLGLVCLHQMDLRVWFLL